MSQTQLRMQQNVQRVIQPITASGVQVTNNVGLLLTLWWSQTGEPGPISYQYITTIGQGNVYTFTPSVTNGTKYYFFVSHGDGIGDYLQVYVNDTSMPIDDVNIQM